MTPESRPTEYHEELLQKINEVSQAIEENRSTAGHMADQFLGLRRSVEQIAVQPHQAVIPQLTYPMTRTLIL